MTREKVATLWRRYLGSTSASPYAAPARATDLSGLPLAYITSADFDPNRDEAITNALRLLQAGVPVELHQWLGTFRGSQAILSAEVSQRQMPRSAPSCAAPWPSDVGAGFPRRGRRRRLRRPAGSTAIASSR
jgi:acetyl esterase